MFCYSHAVCLLRSINVSDSNARGIPCVMNAFKKENDDNVMSWAYMNEGIFYSWAAARISSQRHFECAYSFYCSPPWCVLILLVAYTIQRCIPINVVSHAMLCCSRLPHRAAHCIAFHIALYSIRLRGHAHKPFVRFSSVDSILGGYIPISMIFTV